MQKARMSWNPENMTSSQHDLFCAVLFSDDFDDNKIIVMNIVFILDFRIVSSQPLLHFFQPFVLDEKNYCIYYWAAVWSRKTEFNVALQSENSYSPNKILYFRAPQPVCSPNFFSVFAEILFAGYQLPNWFIRMVKSIKNSKLSDVLILGELRAFFMGQKQTGGIKRELSTFSKSRKQLYCNPKWFTGAEGGSLRMRELWSLFLQISLC